MIRLLILLFSLSLFAIHNSNGQELFEGIDRHQLKISDNQKEINYGASESTIIQKFGTPVKNQPNLLEMDKLKVKECYNI